MQRWLLILGLFFSTGFAQFQQQAISISSPQAGQVLQGVVTITGTTEVEGFVLAEVFFAHDNDPTDTWFLLAAHEQAMIADVLASWDTTTITDGNYALRLQVTLSSGDVLEERITGLRVRNYTPIESQAVNTDPVLAPSAVPVSTPTVRPAPTPLPPNPAAVTRVSILSSLGRGAIFMLGAFLFFGLILKIRRR